MSAIVCMVLITGWCTCTTASLTATIHNFLINMFYHLTNNNYNWKLGFTEVTFRICRKSLAINLSLLNVLYPRVGCGNTKNVTFINFGNFFSTTISTTQAGTVSLRRTPSVSPPASLANSLYNVLPVE